MRHIPPTGQSNRFQRLVVQTLPVFVFGHNFIVHPKYVVQIGHQFQLVFDGTIGGTFSAFLFLMTRLQLRNYRANVGINTLIPAQISLLNGRAVQFLRIYPRQIMRIETKHAVSVATLRATRR